MDKTECFLFARKFPIRILHEVTERTEDSRNCDISHCPPFVEARTLHEVTERTENGKGSDISERPPFVSLENGLHIGKQIRLGKLLVGSATGTVANEAEY